MGLVDMSTQTPLLISISGRTDSSKLWKFSDMWLTSKIHLVQESFPPLFKRSYILLGIFIPLAFFLRLPGLNESLWWDETCHTFIAANAESIKRLLTNDVHPPFYTLFMLGWINLFGDEPVVVRIPSLIGGLGSLALLYFITKDFFDKKTAVLATLFMTLSPVHIWYSQENKNNMVMLFFTLLAVYTLHLFWQENRRTYWYIFIICGLISLWTNHYALWVIIALQLWQWLQVIKVEYRDRLKTVILSSTIFALAYIPLLIYALFKVDIGKWTYLRVFSPTEVYRLFLIYLSHGNTIRTYFPWAPFKELFTINRGFIILDFLFALILILGISRLIIPYLPIKKHAGILSHRKYKQRSLLLMYFILPPVFLLLATPVLGKIYIERSMLILLPPYMMLLAYGVCSLPGPKIKLTVAGILVLINIWALFNLWMVKSDKWTVWMPNPDWRSAAAYFDREVAQNSNFIIVHSTPTRALNYHYSKLIKNKAGSLPVDRLETLPLYPFRGSSGQGVYKFLEYNKINTFYLIHNLHLTGNFKLLFQSTVTNRHVKFREKISLKGLNIYKFEFIGNQRYLKQEKYPPKG